VLGACAQRSPEPPAAADAARYRAALATVTVQNGTAHRLTIAFRPAAAPGGEVVVGEVAPASRATVAPVPAGEPIILMARTEQREELTLAPRSFALDAEWVWEIPFDARFQRREGGTR
jgi:hypothetical protein